MAARSLNIKLPQVLIHYENDGGGLYWHHRILLKKLRAGVFVTLTPDRELQQHDLAEERHLVVLRNSPYPDQAAARELYLHDPITKPELDRFVKQANLRAQLLGDDAVAEVDEQVWVYSETGFDRFGQVVADDLLEDAVLGDAKGVVTVEEGEQFVMLVDRSGLDAWKKSRRESEGDIRLLGDHRGPDGKRVLEFRTAVSLMRNSPLKDNPLPGVRVAKELMQAIMEGPGNLVSYHTEWSRQSGVSDHSAAAHEHRVICEVLRLAHSVDQVDISNLISLEQLCRRLVQLETAVERNPRAPDFSGLELVMSQPTGAGGQAMTPAFTEWLTSKMKEQSVVWKNYRLYKYERGGRRVDEGEDSDDDGPVKRKKKKKKKPTSDGKDGAAPAGGGAQG